MATVQWNIREPDSTRSLTDCENFMNNRCTFDGNCLYRHSFEAKQQSGVCLNWPHRCRKIQCRFRHPVLFTQPEPAILNSSTRLLPKNSVIAFFWDIENVAVPKGQKPFDIVQRIRQKLVVEPELQEIDFSCYCNSTTISEENQRSLGHATVRMIHIPDRKANAVDRQIMLDLDRFGRVHRPPATVVLLSGDIDFVGKLSDLRHHNGFHVIVIHNRPAKQELKATANEHYPWNLFTKGQSMSSTRTSYSNNHLNVSQNHSSQSISTSRSRKVHSRKSPSDSRNTDHVIHRNIPRLSDSPVDFPQQQNVRIIPHQYEDSTARLRLDANQPSSRFDHCENNIHVPQYPSQSPNRGESRKNHRIRGERSTPRDCPFCDTEFDTIQALRQHQNHTRHLYICPTCNQGFFTYEGQIQHQKAKQHDLEEDIDNGTSNDQRDTNQPSTASMVVQGLLGIMRELFS